MIPSKDTTSLQPSLHVNRSSFPPTQKRGLPASATEKPVKRLRSHDQGRNLKASGERLLELLSVQPLQHADAL